MATRAYCAPGRRDDATWALAVASESVDKLTEHPRLEGGTVIVTEDVPVPLPEFEFRGDPARPAWMLADEIAARVHVPVTPLITGTC